MCFILCKEVKYHAIANASSFCYFFLVAVVAAVVVAFFTIIIIALILSTVLHLIIFMLRVLFILLYGAVQLYLVVRWRWDYFNCLDSLFARSDLW